MGCSNSKAGATSVSIAPAVGDTDSGSALQKQDSVAIGFPTSAAHEDKHDFPDLAEGDEQDGADHHDFPDTTPTVAKPRDVNACAKTEASTINGIAGRMSMAIMSSANTAN